MPWPPPPGRATTSRSGPSWSTPSGRELAAARSTRRETDRRPDRARRDPRAARGGHRPGRGARRPGLAPRTVAPSRSRVEPCTMCAGAAVLARVDRIVFGAWEPRTGSRRIVVGRASATGVWPIARRSSGGVREAECAALHHRTSSRPVTARGPEGRPQRAAVDLVGGSVSERPKERASKARVGSAHRGFESHRYRHCAGHPAGMTGVRVSPARVSQEMVAWRVNVGGMSRSSGARSCTEVFPRPSRPESRPPRRMSRTLPTPVSPSAASPHR